MTTRIVTGTARGDVERVARQMQTEIGRELGAEAPRLLMVFASTEQPLADLLPQVQAAFARSVVVGASTAGEFDQCGDVKGGTAYIALTGDYEVRAGIGHGLAADVDGAVRGALDDQPQQVEGYPHRTAILLLDPLAGFSEEAVLLTAARLGEGAALVGGAAGDDLAMSATQVGLGTEVAGDALVIASLYSRRPLGVGVCHGHRPLSEPLQVTRASGNEVQQIDGRPAWQVWLEASAAAAAEHGIDLANLKPEEEGAFLLRFEAGLATGDGEYKIRAPLSRSSDGAIQFACGIPEGSFIRITQSTPARQLDSALDAARRARQSAGGEVAGAVVFDCICRNLILSQDFAAAVRGISQELGDVPLAGFETYGEIASKTGELSGFHNTTTVVLAFPSDAEAAA